jgi:hypothetical protein
MSRLLARIVRRKVLTASGGLVLAAALTVPTATAHRDAEVLPDAAPAAAMAVDAASPFAQSGPRNLIKRLQDTYISSADDADHSQERLLHIGTPDGGATKYRSFLQFDVSRLTGASIKKASLRLYNSFVPAADCGKNPWLGVYRVAEPWNQSTITWANQPSVGEGIAAYFGVGHPTGCEDQPNKYLPERSVGIQRIDVTDMVKAWTTPGTSTPNYGIRLSTQEGAPHPTTGATWYKDFCSMNPTTPDNDRACTEAYFTPTLEVEFNSGATPLITGNEYGPPYAGGYPAAEEALEFLDSNNPLVWEQSKPYQRWLPDAYHAVKDASLKGALWKGGTSHKLRSSSLYGGQVLVAADGGSGFIGVVPYPSLAGYHWALNVRDTGEAGDLHGAELLPDGSVVAAFAGTSDGRSKGRLELYTKKQGTPGAWNNTAASTYYFDGAHEVLYDPSSGYLWAVGSHALKKIGIAGGAFDDKDVETFYLPRQTDARDAEKGAAAYGHDLAPVYGNPDRFWVAGNGGVTQFSKSGAAVCYQGTVSQKWPVRQHVETLRNEKGEVDTRVDGTRHWCTDYPNENLINTRTFVKSIGNDPVTGKVATTCADECPLANIVPEDNNNDGQPDRLYSTPWIEIIDPAVSRPDLRRGAYKWSSNSKHYRATWAVPSYQ